MRTGNRRLPGYALPCLFCLSLCGCSNFWDEVTSNDFSLNTYFNKPNPLVVLRDSQDGDKRAKALRALHEPKQYGGTDEEQEIVIKIVTTAAASERQPLCRLAAIQSLGGFKDPRAVQGLKEAFFNASAFAPDTATVLRCQALTALGNTHNPAAVDLLATVVREPRAEGPDQDKQQTLDIRIAAARALGNFSHYQATSALVDVLRSEKDVALRSRAHESLELATGKHLSEDPKEWDELLHQPGDTSLVEKQQKKIQVLGFSTK
jgi:HEAT repeat protein